MKKRIIIIIVLIFIIAEFLIMISPGEFSLKDASITPTPSINNTKKLKITDTQLGEGEAVKTGDTVVMHYKGILDDGTEFDSSYKRNSPFTTTIGIGTVIKGWDQGIPGMKVGGKRKLVIPPDLGYGENGAPPNIPPNATLTFDVELLEIK